MLNAITSQGESCDMPMKQCEKPSPLATLQDTKRRLEEKLVDVNKAIDFLQRNPDFETGSTLLNKVTRF